MSDQAHTMFGIDEVYIHEGLSSELLEKLRQRATLSLDGEEKIVLKNVSYDMILIFYNKVVNRSLIYRFLEHLNKDKQRDNYIKSHTLINEEELYSAIKSKTFILVTPKILLKELDP